MLQRTRHWLTLRLGRFELTVFNWAHGRRVDWWSSPSSAGIRVYCVWQFWLMYDKRSGNEGEATS